MDQAATAAPVGLPAHHLFRGCSGNVFQRESTRLARAVDAFLRVGRGTHQHPGARFNLSGLAAIVAGVAPEFWEGGASGAVRWLR